jgi:hypothetical protein
MMLPREGARKMEEEEEQKAMKARLDALRALIKRDPLAAVPGLMEIVSNQALERYVNAELHRLEEALSTGKMTQAEVSGELSNLLDRIQKLRGFS